MGNSPYPGQSLFSDNSLYRTTVQGDGNVGVFGPGNRLLWASMTPGANGHVTVQRPGPTRGPASNASGGPSGVPTDFRTPEPWASRSQSEVVDGVVQERGVLAVVDVDHRV